MWFSKPSLPQKRDFTFLQANVNGCYDGQQGLLQHGAKEDHWDLILIQEANRSTEKLSERSYGYALIKMSRVREQPGRNISTCVYARMNSPLGVPEYVPLEEEDCSCSGEARESHIEHICTVCYDLPDGGRLFVTNTYNRTSEKIPVDCLTAHLHYVGYHFDAGDYNMHDSDWDKDLLKPRPRAEPRTKLFMKQIYDYGLQLLTNTFGEPTWANGYLSSIVDLAMASPELECDTAKLRNDLIMGGMDHVPMQTTGKVLTDSQPVLGRNWNKANEGAITTGIKDHVQAAQKLPMDTRSQVQDHAQNFVAALQHLQETHIPRHVRSTRLRYDTDTPEIRKLAAQTKAAGLERDTAHRLSRRMHKRYDYQRSLRKAIFAPYHQRQRKWSHLDDRLRKLRDLEFRRQWRSSFAGVSKWAWLRYTKRKGRARAPVTVPNLRVLDQHGNVVGRTSSAHEKVSTLREAWYGPEQDVQPNDEPMSCDTETSAARGPLCPLQTMKRAKLKMIFKNLKERTAAGYDEVGPRFLKTFGPLFMTYLTHLWNACLRLCFIPDIFKIGRTIPIAKFGLGMIYDLANQFRPICLLSTLGKTLESYLADVLAGYVRLFKLLPGTQFAARGRSINMALLLLLELIQMARRSNLALAVMCMDQRTAYNAVLFKELLRVFRAKGVPEWIISMTQSWLSGRWTTIRIPGFESAPMRCGGLPQGSPFSPILFAIFTCFLLEVVELECEVGRVFKFAYSDDTYIVVIGTSLAEIKPVLASQYRACLAWAEESGASFGAHKTKIIHFASPAQNNDRPMSKHIPGFNDKLEFDCTTTGDDDYMTILGVRFAVDSQGNLTWAAHWRHLEKRFDELVTEFSRIVKSTYGLCIVDASHVFKAGARAALLSGSIAWMEFCDDPWFLRKPSDEPYQPNSVKDDSGIYTLAGSLRPYYTPNSVRLKRQNRLQEMGDKFTRMVIGSFARTPRWFRRAEVSLEPLDLFAYRSNMTTRANIMGTPEWDTIVSARNRVRDYARKVYADPDRDLREGRGHNFVEPMTTLEEQAAKWKETAEADIELRAQTLKQRKRKRATFEEDSSEDNVADGSISPDGADAVAEFHATVGIPPEDEDSDEVDDSRPQRLKSRLKANSNAWSDEVVTNHYEYWRQARLKEFVKAYPGRVVPAALRTRWSRQNVKRYGNLSRPLDYLLFGLRTEYIGLLHHRRELCGSDIDDSHCRKCKGRDSHYETITHLLHYCPALKKERQELYNEVFSTVPSITSYADMKRDIIEKAPELVAMYVLEHFPVDQIEWTRKNMLDLIKEPEEGDD